MADYRDNYEDIRNSGAEVVAISVDSPKDSAALKADLDLSFMILSDADRKVIRDWGILNPQERGGIAKPAVFVIDADRVVRFASIDSVRKRVPAREIVRVLGSSTDASLERHPYTPRFKDLLRAIRNSFRALRS